MNLPNSFLPIIQEFRKDYNIDSNVTEEILLLFAQEIMRKCDIFERYKDYICTDKSCFCGKYNKGDKMKNCDGGCMYPGA